MSTRKLNRMKSEKPKSIDQSDPGKLDLESLDRDSGKAKSACH